MTDTDSIIIWKRNIFSAIKNISDKEFQEDAWFGLDKNKRYVSSFIEIISMLFSTYCFEDEFWKEENLKSFNFSENLLSEMKILKDMIDHYLSSKEKHSDSEVFLDPKWDNIREQAKKIIAIWVKEDPSVKENANNAVEK